MHRFRSTRRLLCLSLALALLIASCGREDPQPATEPTGPEPGQQPETPTDPDAPVHGGTMVIPLGSDPAHLNRGFQTGPEVGIVALAMQEALVRVTAALDVIPSLAESWEISDDGLEYTFNLRQGVTWHDDEPFTSADVMYTLQEVTPLHPSGPAIIDLIDSMEATDDHTVVITLNAPSAIFLQSLMSDNAPILPAHIYEGTDVVTNPANLAPVGTGPFKFVEWVSGERIVLERNDDYWDAPKPYLDQLIFQIIPDGTTRLNALLQGEVDMILRGHIDPRTVDQLEAADNVAVSSGPGSVSMRPIYFNHEREPLGDPEVRKALIQAIDRQGMVDTIFEGRGEVGRTSLPHNFDVFHHPDIDYEQMYPFDPDAAATRLDELGYEAGPDGIRFSLDYLFTDEYLGTREMGEIMRANFEEIGVELRLEQREVEVYGDTVFPQRNYDIASNILGSRIDPMLGVDRIFLCEEDREVRFSNPTSYCNPELDAIFAQANTAVDPDERREFYWQTQEIIAEDMPSIIALSLHNTDAISTRFGGREAFYNIAGGSVDVEWRELWVLP